MWVRLNWKGAEHVTKVITKSAANPRESVAKETWVLLDRSAGRVPAPHYVSNFQRVDFG
jgi:hypothetical protein